MNNDITIIVGNRILKISPFFAFIITLHNWLFFKYVVYHPSIQNTAHAKIIIDTDNIISIAKDTSFLRKYSTKVRTSDGM